LLILPGLLGAIAGACWWETGVVMLPKIHAFGMVAALAFGAGLPCFAADAVPAPQRDALANPPPAATPASQPAEDMPAKKPETQEQNQDGIVALVNDLPITAYELRQRVALVMSTSKIPPGMEKKVREQVLDELETELLQRQEALKNDISVSSVEVDKEIKSILDDNHMTIDQLKAVLDRGNVSLATFRAQISARLLWQKAVQEHYAGRVNITPDQVDVEMARIAEGKEKAHFLVSEIFLPVDNPDLDAKVLKDAQNLETQLQAGAQFASVARQFSQSPSAAQGGDMGVVYDGQLAPELNKALESMKTGDMSQPIRAIGGYYILLLRQRFEPAGTKIVETQPSEATLPDTLPLARILLPLPANTPKNVIGNVLKAGEQIREHITSCEIAGKIPKEVPGAQFFNMGMTRLSDLNQQTRDALAKTESGGTAEPFLSAVGVEIFVRCDKAVPKLQAWTPLTREQVEQQLFEEQISALARRYERDLRRNADIEVR
jgi:peptidyl-prolyl cis-trans isomerase SurA